MSPTVLMICSFGLNFGVPLGFAVRELVVTRPVRRGGGPAPEPTPPEAPRPLPAGQKQLPDCLIPKPMKIRELA